MLGHVVWMEDDVSVRRDINAKIIGIVGEKNDHINVAGTIWWKLFPFSVFPTIRGVRRIKGPRKKYLSMSKFDFRTV